MTVDPACIPELAKVILLVLSAASDQTNGHKLARLKAAFEKVDKAIQIWQSMHGILSDYGDLFDWLDKMDKKQQFFNFWTIRKKISLINRDVKAVQRLIRRANIRSGCDKGRMLSMTAEYDELSAKNKGELTPAQKHELKLKEMETKVEVEKTVASVRKLLMGIEAADDRDLALRIHHSDKANANTDSVIQEYQATRDKISASFAMIFGQSSTASSPSGEVNETAPILDTSRTVQTFLHDEERREVERAQRLYEGSHAESDPVADGNAPHSLDVELDINNSEIDFTLGADDVD